MTCWADVRSIQVLEGRYTEVPFLQDWDLRLPTQHEMQGIVAINPSPGGTTSLKCRPSGTRILKSRTQHFMLGFHIARLRRNKKRIPRSRRRKIRSQEAL